MFLERFSIKCYKTKTRVITLANHKNTGNTVNQSNLKVNTAAGTKHKKMCVTKSQYKGSRREGGGDSGPDGGLCFVPTNKPMLYESLAFFITH